MKSAPTKILVVRNDRLGDFMLAYPAFMLLKQSLPESSIHALVPYYTREMAECCPGIDTVVTDPGPQAGVKEQQALLARLRRERYQAVVALYSTVRVGLLALLAGIPYRLAPATKVAQLFYNTRLLQRRSRSEKPEHAYNLDLGLKLLTDFEITSVRMPMRPYLSFQREEIDSLRQEFCRTRGIPPEQRLILVHPGHGGSANNLSVEQYAALVRRLRSPAPFTVVITAGPGEEASARRLEALLTGINRTVYRSDRGLRCFSKHIQLADLFISGSTGPLHIAGALDRPTAAFYTRRQSATSLRWQTLNSPDRRLAFSPPEEAGPEEMSAVDLDAAAETINRAYLARQTR